MSNSYDLSSAVYKQCTCKICARTTMPCPCGQRPRCHNLEVKQQVDTAAAADMLTDPSLATVGLCCKLADLFSVKHAVDLLSWQR